jgi:hypothetical protein
MPDKYTTVAEFLSGQDPAKRQQVELLRAVINEAYPGLDEHIKWNSPSYVLDGEDRVTFNLQNKDNVVKLVLHMGATRAEDKKGPPIMADDKGLIAWQSDIRGVITFADMHDITANRADVRDLVARWLAIA